MGMLLCLRSSSGVRSACRAQGGPSPGVVRPSITRHFSFRGAAWRHSVDTNKSLFIVSTCRYLIFWRPVAFLTHIRHILLISCFRVSRICPAKNLPHVHSIKLRGKGIHVENKSPSQPTVKRMEPQHQFCCERVERGAEISRELLPQRLALTQIARASNAVILSVLLNIKSITKICRKKNECNIFQGHSFPRRQCNGAGLAVVRQRRCRRPHVSQHPNRLAALLGQQTRPVTGCLSTEAPR